jgi:hypothetical protein
MKEDYVVKGRFEAIVGVREEKIERNFLYIFRKIRLENPHQLLRERAEGSIEEALRSEHGREVEVSDLEINAIARLIGLGDERVRKLQDFSGIGKDIPDVLEEYLSLNSL